MQPHDRVNFGGLCIACSVFLSRASRGFSLTSAVPFIAYRSRCILVYTHLLGSCSDYGSKNEAYNLDVLVLLRFVSFPGLKNEAYTCVLSLFRRAFAPFHGFTVLVSTRGFKNELCHSRSVLVSAHCFKNELYFLCSVLVLTHRFKNDLCVPTSVLVSTHGFKNEFCCLLGLPFST